MQFRACFAGQDHQAKENLRKSETHRVHECVYLIEACHRSVPQVNIIVGISLTIPWLKS